jgi:hypothetical protein
MGGAGLYDDLQRLVNEAKSNAPVVFKQFCCAYKKPDEIFQGQWSNLFEIKREDEITHATCSLYQMKYEVELPLVFLHQLLDIALHGKLELKLTRHGNAKGKLKKGQIANAITAQSTSYPHLHRMLRTAYLPKLRHCLAHNDYKIIEQTIQSLDGTVKVTKQEFIESLFSLQQVQNAVLWIAANLGERPAALATHGIISVGFDMMLGVPLLRAYQLAPFHELQPKANWAARILFRVRDGQVHTQVGQAWEQEGELNSHLASWLRSVHDSRNLASIITPIMPCIHVDDHALNTPWGDFCPYGKPTEIILPAKVLGLK